MSYCDIYGWVVTEVKIGPKVIKGSIQNLEGVYKVKYE